MSEVINLSELTLEEINYCNVLRDELLNNQQFIDFANKYNLNSEKNKKEKKTIEELFNIGFKRRLKAKLSNDIMFGQFCQDIDVCIRLLKIFLKSKNIKIGDVERIEPQKSIELGIEIKGVRLDVFVKDSDRVYTIEMQVGTQNQLAQRMRYYQGITDIHLLPKGATYDQLKESYIIFICTDYDPFKRKKVEYSIEPYACIENEEGEKEYLHFDTKAHWVVFNVSAFESIEDDEDELKSLFAYMKGKPLDNDFTKYIDGHFQNIKLNTEKGFDFMFSTMRDYEKYQEGKEEGRLEGKEEGRLNERIDIIQELLKRYKTSEKVHEIVGFPIDEIQYVIDNNKSN